MPASNMSDNTSAGTSSAAGYFDRSIPTTPTSTPASTPNLGRHGVAPSSPLSPMEKEFPKPTYEINIGEALKRPPGRWTIQGQIDANEHRAKQQADKAVDKEKRARDLEAAKKDLLASFRNLSSKAVKPIR